MTSFVQLEFMSERTGTQVLLIGVRSEPDHYNGPFILFTDDRIRLFTELRLKHTLEELAQRLEGFLVSGVTGE